MAEAKKDPQIAALEAVHNALKDLEPGVRKRVLASVYALLDIPVSADTVAVREDKLPGPAKQADVPAARTQGARPVSLIELMQEKEPTINAERIALFAYYREKHEMKARFGRADLESYFPKAKLSPPGNYDRDFVKAVRRGWIHEDGDDSYLTSKGLEAVETGFSGDRSQRQKSPKKQKAAKARSR